MVWDLVHDTLLLVLRHQLTVVIERQKGSSTMVQWKRISEQRPSETDYLKMHLCGNPGAVQSECASDGGRDSNLCGHSTVESRASITWVDRDGRTCNQG